MKNAIYYYYQLTSYNITQSSNNYYFKSDNFNYCLMPLEENIDIKEKYDLNVKLLNYGIPCHQIILNKDQNIVTYINSKMYILLKIFVDYNKKIEINDVFQFQNKFFEYKLVEQLKKISWKQLWINKIDYLEYQITQFGKKYPIIRESFSYYIGLGENALEMLSNMKDNAAIKIISHYRIHNDDTLFNLYNPLNFVNDCRIRDIVEYIKDQFFFSNITYTEIINEIKYYILNSNLNYEELYLLFSRLLYPSYYFDLYEEIVLDTKDEYEIKKVLEKTNEFEQFLKETYNYISTLITLPEIDWIKKI